MFAYAVPARIARRISPNEPASMPWPLGPMTSAAVTSPSTVPSTFGARSWFRAAATKKERHAAHHRPPSEVDVREQSVPTLEPAVRQDVVELVVVDEFRAELPPAGAGNRGRLLVAVEMGLEFPGVRRVDESSDAATLTIVAAASTTTASATETSRGILRVTHCPPFCRPPWYAHQRGGRRRI